MKLLGMEKTRYLFKFYYIGADEYFGSQRQPNYLTIEECLLTALQEKNYIPGAKKSGFEVAISSFQLGDLHFLLLLKKYPY